MRIAMSFDSPLLRTSWLSLTPCVETDPIVALSRNDCHQPPIPSHDSSGLCCPAAPSIQTAFPNWVRGVLVNLKVERPISLSSTLSVDPKTIDCLVMPKTSTSKKPLRDTRTPAMIMNVLEMSTWTIRRKRAAANGRLQIT